MNRFWANHRMKDTHVPGETIHRGGITDATTRGTSPDRCVAGGYPRDF